MIESGAYISWNNFVTSFFYIYKHAIYVKYFFSSNTKSAISPTSFTLNRMLLKSKFDVLYKSQMTPNIHEFAIFIGSVEQI